MSRSTCIGRVAAISAGTSAPAACSTRLADQGAPPTLRRISTYSTGLGTRPSFDVGEFPQGLVEEVLGAFSEPVPPVRGHGRDGAAHRSERPRSTGLVGVSVITPSAGMNARSLSRYSYPQAVVAFDLGESVGKDTPPCALC